MAARGRLRTWNVYRGDLAVLRNDAECDQVLGCTQPVGYVESGDDSHDENGFINPGAEEVCDLLDNDCDGTTDEGCT